MVVHAEGPGETGPTSPWLAPTHPLTEDDLGPAHLLVRRVLHEGHRVPPGAVEFREPLRLRTGRRALGSDLLSPSNLDDLLTPWLLDRLLVVLLVDADGTAPADRQSILDAALVRVGLPGATGVAVQEFEAWLIADPSAVRTVFGGSHRAPAHPESLAPGEAKALLQRWTRDAARPGRPAHALRRELADAADLDVLAARCPSFARFRTAVRILQVA